MQSAHPELGDQAFGNVADALVTVEYESPEPEEPSQEATGDRSAERTAIRNQFPCIFMSEHRPWI